MEVLITIRIKEITDKAVLSYLGDNQITLPLAEKMELLCQSDLQMCNPETPKLLWVRLTINVDTCFRELTRHAHLILKRNNILFKTWKKTSAFRTIALLRTSFKNYPLLWMFCFKDANHNKINPTHKRDPR